jgi:hypothetical protein
MWAARFINLDGRFRRQIISRNPTVHCDETSRFLVGIRETWCLNNQVVGANNFTCVRGFCRDFQARQYAGEGVSIKRWKIELGMSDVAAWCNVLVRTVLDWLRIRNQVVHSGNAVTKGKAEEIVHGILGIVRAVG